MSHMNTPREARGVEPARLPFDDRHSAGQLLGRRLRALALHDPVVLALPRGGVPVAEEVARALHAPLDLLLVRKVGAPDQPELALAAVVEGRPPAVIVNESVQALVQAPPAWLAAAVRRETAEIARRRQAYLQGRATLALRGREVVLVDDGIATGTTVRAALTGLRAQGVKRVVLAVPVAPSDAVAQLRGDVDDLVCLARPWPFEAIGLHYRDFHQLDDDEVNACLERAQASLDEPPQPSL
jgi:putative phosphoribosyl transferase